MDFQKHCTLFLERMRYSSSFELVQRVKAFVNQFYGTQGSAEEYSRKIHQFIEVRTKNVDGLLNSTLNFIPTAYYR